MRDIGLLLGCRLRGYDASEGHQRKIQKVLSGPPKKLQRKRITKKKKHWTV
jgi:hypothetical protein